MNITCDPSFKAICPDTALAVLRYSAEVKSDGEALAALLQKTTETIQATTALEAIAKNPHIAATRAAYKALGKDPSAYRNAAEALLRRIVKGQTLTYQQRCRYQQSDFRFFRLFDWRLRYRTASLTDLFEAG